VFKDRTESADERSAFRKAQEKKRRDQLAADDKQKLIEGAGRDAFDEIRDAKFAGYRFGKGKRKGEINAEKLARALREAIKVAARDEPQFWPEVRALKNRVNEWLTPADRISESSADSESAPASVY
jgi:hypothetical protein